jgi:hypothetical protein
MLIKFVFLKMASMFIIYSCNEPFWLAHRHYKHNFGINYFFDLDELAIFHKKFNYFLK